MAKVLITLTDDWQQVATGAVTITIETVGEDVVQFDEASDPDTAYTSSPKVGDQFVQDEALPTFARGIGGWAIVVDGSL